MALKKRNANKTIVVGLLVIVLAVSLLGSGNFFAGGNNDQQANAPDSATSHNYTVDCINPILGVIPAYHIHPHLRITVNGKNVPIPANIGLGDIWGCEREIHTHDESGTIHLEPSQQRDFVLGHFFNIWGKTFSKDQILESRVDDAHEIVMTVDGQPSQDFENLKLADKQDIVIEYKTKEGMSAVGSTTVNINL